MRCPKCGYNSFEHLDSCKKCGKDLAEHKARFNIRSILLSELPAEEMSAVAEEAVAAAAAPVPDMPMDDFAADTAGDDMDDFGFDFMGDSEEEESLAFDELFEEVPAEDEVEETLPAPDAAADEATPRPLDEELAAEKTPAEFSFDASEPEAAADDFSVDTAEDFGFDDDPDADIFAESEEDFSIENGNFDEPDKD